MLSTRVAGGASATPTQADSRQAPFHVASVARPLRLGALQQRIRLPLQLAEGVGTEDIANEREAVGVIRVEIDLRAHVGRIRTQVALSPVRKMAVTSWL